MLAFGGDASASLASSSASFCRNLMHCVWVCVYEPLITTSHPLDMSSEKSRGPPREHSWLLNEEGYATADTGSDQPSVPASVLQVEWPGAKPRTPKDNNNRCTLISSCAVNVKKASYSRKGVSKCVFVAVLVPLLVGVGLFAEVLLLWLRREVVTKLRPASVAIFLGTIIEPTIKMSGSTIAKIPFSACFSKSRELLSSSPSPEASRDSLRGFHRRQGAGRPKAEFSSHKFELMPRMPHAALHAFCTSRTGPCSGCRRWKQLRWILSSWLFWKAPKAIAEQAEFKLDLDLCCRCLRSRRECRCQGSQSGGQGHLSGIRLEARY